MTGPRSIGAAFHILCAALLLLLCAAVYSNTWSSPFTFDDGPNIQANAAIRMTQLDVPSLWVAGFESRSPRPVAYMSFALNYYLGDYDVRGYHIVNIFIHWLTGLCVYWLASDLFRRQRALRPAGVDSANDRSLWLLSLLAAAIFVAHPIQTQAVTYIVQRMSSMATMFYLLALALYICGRDREDRKRWLLWAGSCACWLLALGSKETAITLPLLVGLYEWYFRQDLDLDWFKQRIPLILGAAIGLAFVATLFQIDTAFDYRYRDFTLWERLLTQSRVLVQYLGLLVCPLPSRLNLTHDVPVSHSLTDPVATLFSTLSLLALFVLALRVARSQRLLSFCILWFFINLAIESSFVALEMMFEHRLYLPMVAFSVLVADGLRWVSVRLGLRVWAALASVGLVVALGFASYERNEAWRDELTLWSDVVSKSPEDSRAHSNLGRVLRTLGKLDEATAHLSRAIELNGNYLPPRWTLAEVALDRGDTREAIRQLQGALAVELDDPRADPYIATAHRLVARLLVRQGQWSEAREHASEAVRITPELPVSLMRLAWTLMMDPGASAVDLERAVKLAKRADTLTEHAAPRVLDTLASAYATAGRFGDAANVVRDLLDIELTAKGARVSYLRTRLENYERAAENSSNAGSMPAPRPIDSPPSSSDRESLRPGSLESGEW